MGIWESGRRSVKGQASNIAAQRESDTGEGHGERQNMKRKDTLEERSRARRKRIVGHRAKDFADAERWDLEFWQKQTPQARLSALVELREDLALIPGRNRTFDNE